MPNDPQTILSPAEQRQLLQYARRSISWGLEHNGCMPVPVHALTGSVARVGSSFVTLRIDRELRGCIGRLNATRPLLVDVVENAYSAAFSDFRFAPLTAPELPKVTISISVLTQPLAIQFTSQENLLQQLKPGIDGLVLSAQGHSSTFLPSVWESLQTPREFLGQLKRKAGLSATFWSDDIRIERYQTLEFSELDV